MPVIDADTHVDETEDSWSFLRPEEAALRPGTGFPSDREANPFMRYWLIDGRRQIRFIRNDAQTKTTVETRELLDVQARLRDMDRLRVDVQVMYPTLFIVEFTDKPELELALRRSYNRWMAERWRQAGGRLRWVMLPPTMSMPAALEELRFAADHGACGVLKKGNMEAGAWVVDPYFFPLYEEAAKLGLPICFHTGSGVADFTPARQFTYSNFYRLTLPVVHAFESLIVHGVPAQFPNLRWGFIEATASWVPFVLYDLRRRLAKSKVQTESALRASAPRSYDMPADVLRKNNMYVAVQVDEDLPYLLGQTGEDNLLVGSDYTHNDAAQEMDFRKLLQERADRGDFGQSVVDKITYHNPKEFYGL